MSIGFTVPFSVSTGSVGYFETTSDVFAATKYDIISLLITNWGERPMHSNMGCNFRGFLFENDSSDELKTRVADRVASQLAMWLPFVSVKSLFVKSCAELSKVV